MSVTPPASPPPVIARRILITGVPQHGKTVLAEHLVDDLLRADPQARALIWDGVREVQYRGVVCETLDEWRQAPRARRFVFRGGVPVPAVATLALELTRLRPGAPPPARIVLVVDEMARRDVVIASHWAHQSLLDCTTKARLVSFIGTMQAPRHAPTDLRSVFTDLYSFRLDDQADLDALANRGMPERYLPWVRRLKPHRFVHYHRW